MTNDEIKKMWEIAEPYQDEKAEKYFSKEEQEKNLNAFLYGLSVLKAINDAVNKKLC